MRIRTAVPDDAEAIERARVRAWRTAYRHVFPPEELDRMPIDGSRWRAQLEEDPTGEACLVCEEHGQVVGWVRFGVSATPLLGEVHGLYVDPDAWSTGAGRALMAGAEAELAGSYPAAVLWVLEANDRARRFYESAGWSADGRRGTFERFGIAAPVVGYRKSLSSTASRS